MHALPRRRDRASTLLAAAALALTLTWAPSASAASYTWDADGWGYSVGASSVMYTSPLGDFDVTGGIDSAHRGLGGGTGAVGYPAGAETSQGPGYSYQVFERAVVYAAPFGAHSVRNGPFRDAHSRFGGGAGALGYPTAEQVGQGGGYWYQTFERGVIYVSPRGAYGVTWEALPTHRYFGGGGGSLGYPVGDQTAQGGGFSYQVFERGVIYASKYGSHAVKGGFLARHNASGGGGGTYGYPRGNEVAWGDGSWTQAFERGEIRIGGSVTDPGTGSTGGSVYYANCTEVRNAGKAPIYRGQPGYGPHLDRDDDGKGCEN